MAVLVRGKPIFHQLNSSIDYAYNPEKTSYNPDPQESADILEMLQPYIDPKYTGKFLLKSAINCDSYETAYADMQATKTHYRKLDKRLGYHFYQSFHPDESVNPVQVHEIGLRLAQECWGESFEIAIGTHLNEEHLHNHFIINSVSFIDGLKYRDKLPFLKQFREINDRICKEYGLSIIDLSDTNRSKVHIKDRPSKDKLPKPNGIMRADIDACIRLSLSFDEFIQRLKSLGYTIPRYGPTIKYMSIRPPGKTADGKPRGSRRIHELGDEYSVDAIQHRIAQNTIEQVRQARKEAYEALPEPLSLPKPARITLPSQWRSPKRLNGLQARYYRILYTLGMVRRRPRGDGNRALYFSLRDQVREFSSYVRQAQLLRSNGIVSVSHLHEYRESIQLQVSEVTKQRRSLYYQRKQGILPEAEVDAVINRLTTQLKELRLAWHDCNAIEERSETTAQRLEVVQQYEKEQRQKATRGVTR